MEPASSLIDLSDTAELSNGAQDAVAPIVAPQQNGHAFPVIDLRSDTVTRPTPEMLQAMLTAEVGDDVWGDDPTVNQLQDTVADMFGMDAALFCPTGTMTNQIAIKVHTRAGDELIAADSSHIYWYEGGGIAFNSGVQAKLLPGDRGRITAAQVAEAMNPEDPHFPNTTLVCLENTSNKGGGAIYHWQDMADICNLCHERGLKVHLDGARIFNALVESTYNTRDLGRIFDSISVCLSKGLGCPVGSVLVGSREFIHRARRIRKVLGGAMRQAGFLAAAGIYALNHHVERLREDHIRAKRLAACLERQPYIEDVLPVETNIVIFHTKPYVSPEAVENALAAQGVLLSKMSATTLRIVTHLGIEDDAVERAMMAISSLHFPAPPNISKLSSQRSSPRQSSD